MSKPVTRTEVGNTASVPASARASRGCRSARGRRRTRCRARRGRARPGRPAASGRGRPRIRPARAAKRSIAACRSATSITCACARGSGRSASEARKASTTPSKPRGALHQRAAMHHAAVQEQAQHLDLVDLAIGPGLDPGLVGAEVEPVPDRHPVPPPELARDAPGLDVLQPVEIDLAVLLGHDLGAAVGHRLQRRRAPASRHRRTTGRSASARPPLSSGRRTAA